MIQILPEKQFSDGRDKIKGLALSAKPLLSSAWAACGCVYSQAAQNSIILHLKKFVKHFFLYILHKKIPYFCTCNPAQKMIYFNYSKGKEPDRVKVEIMINIRTLRKIGNNGGLTLKNGKPIVYKSGWQVATEGIETPDINKVLQFVKAYGGNCGLWLSDGIWYIDKSHRVNTKREALEIGRACNQISILRWRDMGLAYC